MLNSAVQTSHLSSSARKTNSNPTHTLPFTQQTNPPTDLPWCCTDRPAKREREGEREKERERERERGGERERERGREGEREGEGERGERGGRERKTEKAPVPKYKK